MKLRIAFRGILWCLIISTTALRSQENRDPKSVEPISIEGIKHLTTERHGKVLFLNLWATWCKPCVEEFPEIEKLRRSYPDSLIEIVAVSVDYPDETASKILPFLQQHRVSFPILVADAPKQDDLINTLNRSWSGAIPATFIYDRRGVQRAALMGQRDMNAFKIAVDSVLQAP